MDQEHQPIPEPRQGLIARTLMEWKTLALLGSPILVAQLAQMANGVIDTIMAGNYGAVDLAGVGIGGSLWSPLFLFFMGCLSALQPVVSGHRGANQLARIMPAVWQGIYIAAGCSVVMIALLINVQPVLNLLQLDAAAASVTTGYLKSFSLGIPALLLLVALRGLTDGLGHTRTFMAFSLLGTCVNLPLNYVLIYGKFGLPELGGVGCGWATAISQWVSVTALLIYLNRSKLYSRFHLISDWVAPRWLDIRGLLRLGIPIGFTIFVEASVFAVIALFLAPLGPVVVAGHQIVLNVVSLLFMVPLSLGMALTLRISFLLGAKAPDTARLLGRSSLLLALGIALVYAPLLFVSRDLIAVLYTQDSAVRTVAAQLMVFGAVFQIADVVQVTAISALRGYRDTRVPMLIMLLSFWGVCLPLGYVLTFTDYLTASAMGANGFWLALTAGLATASVLLTARLFRFQAKTVTAST